MLAVGTEKKTVMQLWEGDWDMQLTKNTIEKKYNCILIRDFGFDDSHLFWTAHENDEGDLGEWLAEGWTLKEIVEELESRQSKGA